jgi:hypothetical protein
MFSSISVNIFLEYFYIVSSTRLLRQAVNDVLIESV